MVVAYFVPHNEGIITGIIGAPGQEVPLIDLYEVDATLKSFDSFDQAIVWLNDKILKMVGPEIANTMHPDLHYAPYYHIDHEYK